MLAYVFWHAPAEAVALERYEQALEGFHRSLAHSPPFGFAGSAAFRLGEVPWAERSGPGAPAPGAGTWYEDWYLVEDFAALGILAEAAVSRGHRTSHERAAKGLASGTAGLYRLLEGAVAGAEAIVAVRHATWVAPAAGAASAEIGAMLGDGADREGSSLWQRQLVLGPAPEFCVLSREPPAGAAPTRLAPRWSARTLPHDALF